MLKRIIFVVSQLLRSMGLTTVCEETGAKET